MKTSSVEFGKTKLSKIVSSTFFIVALGPSVALSAPDDAVGSDGTVILSQPVSSASVRTERGFSGERAVSPGALAVEGAETNISLAEMKIVATAKDPADRRTAVNPETVLGADTRERLYTTNLLSRQRVLIYWQSGSSGYICSGTLIGSNTVATAGHCVSPGNNTGYYNVSTYKIYAGANGTYASPWGGCTAKSLHSVNGWTQSGSQYYDYGAIKLNCTIGNTLGWYGFTTAGTTNFPATIAGYPGDKSLQQWESHGVIKYNPYYSASADYRKLYYENDTYGGMSGSGIWYDNRTSGRMLIGIHAYGTGGSGYNASYNSGVRITPVIYNNLLAWKNLP